MAIGREHPQASRKGKSNLLLGLTLGGFVALVFAIPVVKMMGGANMEAFDHVVRPQLMLEVEE